MFLKCLFFVCVWFCSIWSLEIVGNLFFHSRWVLLSTLKFLLAAQFAKPCDISPRFKLTWRIRARQQRRRWNSWRLAAKNWKVLDDGKEAHQNGFRHFSFQQKKMVWKIVDSEKPECQTKLPRMFPMKLHFSWIFYSRKLQVQIPIKNIMIPIRNALKD